MHARATERIRITSCVSLVVVNAFYEHGQVHGKGGGGTLKRAQMVPPCGLRRGADPSIWGWYRLTYPGDLRECRVTFTLLSPLGKSGKTPPFLRAIPWKEASWSQCVAGCALRVDTLAALATLLLPSWLSLVSTK